MTSVVNREHCQANEKLIGAVAREVLAEFAKRKINPRKVAAGMVADRIAASRRKPRKSWGEARAEIRARLRVFEAA